MRARLQLVFGVLASLLLGGQSHAQDVDNFVASYREAFVHGDLTAALSAVQEALDAERQVSGDQTFALLPIERDYAVILAATGRYAEAAERLRGLLKQAEDGGSPTLAAAFTVDLSDVLAELGQRDEARALFTKAMKIERGLGSDAITRGGSGEASAAGINTRAARFHQSVWDLISKAAAEIDGYGRYSYVLYSTQPVSTDKFLAELLNRVSVAGRIEESKSNLNIFYLPVRTEMHQKLLAQAIAPGEEQPQLPTSRIAAAYDVDLARSMLNQFCRLQDDAQQTPAGMCRSGSASDGPYVLVTSSPWRERGTPGFRAVLLDLSGHEPSVEPVVIRALLLVAHSQQPGEFDLLTTTRLQVADALVQSGGIAQGVVDRMVQLVKLRSR